MRALCVFSGGLDSILAVQIVRSQGVDVLGIFFKTPFFSPDRAIRSAKGIQLPLKIQDITEEHLKIVRSPKYGYGKNMNPCIDCHILMLKTAHEIMNEEDAHFVISGEVLGQRPMSQNRKALDIIARESGLGRLLLRPLSAKRLPQTIPEEKGWIKREFLLDFSGRSRKPQMELAKKLNIFDYPSPAGGCLLTERVFSLRLKDLMDFKPDFEIREIELLKLGRHFRINESAKIIVGRNQKENEKILELTKGEDIVLVPFDRPGPTVVLMGKDDQKSLGLALDITATYSNVKHGNEIDIKVLYMNKTKILKGKAHEKRDFHGLLIS